MNYQQAPEADGMAKTRNLLAEAAEELERLEIEASQAFRRLTALAETLARLERLAVSHQPEAVMAVAIDAATARREAQLLLRYINTSEWSIGSLRNLVDFLALGL
jgi:hypothetical protein